MYHEHLRLAANAFRELHLPRVLTRTLCGAALVIVGPVIADVRSQEAAPGVSPLASCDSVALRPDKGGIAGVVRIGNGLRAPSATIVVAWSELGIGPDRMVRQRTAALSSRANADGAYAICGVPAATRLVAFASTDAGDTTGYILTEVDIGRVAQVDFRVPSHRVDAGGTFTSRINGTVRRKGGMGIAGARVSVVGSTASAVTDKDGNFRISDVTEGTTGLEVIALGFTPATSIANAGEPAEIIMVPAAVVLDSVWTVTARLDHRDELAGFEQRRRSGNGYFLTESQIADMHPTRNADIVSRIPGLRIMTKRGGFSPGAGVASDSTFVVKDGRVALDERRSACRVDVIVDGLRKNPDDLEILPPSSIRAIEVHDVASLPPQFRGGMCGALMIWTKR